MITERREHSRETDASEVTLTIRRREIPCRLENVSTAGAYMAVDSRHRTNVSQADVGEEVSVHFNSGSPAHTKNGIILRLHQDQLNTYLAVYFTGAQK